MPIRNLADVIELEKVPIWERIPEQNVFERLRGVGERQPNHLAIQALLTGEADEIPREIFYDEFIQKTTQAGNLFINLGVGPESVVALLPFLSPEALFALFGAMAVGIASPLNPLLETSHLIGILQETAAAVLVYSSEWLTPETLKQLDRIRAAVPGLKAVIQLGGQDKLPPGVIDFEQALAAQPADRLRQDKAPTREDVAALFHTGGTTGRPKLAQLTHGGLLVATWTIATVTTDAPDAISFLGLPLFHAAGAIVLGLTRLAWGQTVVLLTPFGLRNPTIVRNHWLWVERLRATMIAGVPTTLFALLSAGNEQFDRSLVRLCLSGAAAVPVELAKRFQHKFGIPLVEAYGMTETYGSVAINPYAGECRYGSVGLRMPYLEVIIAELDSVGEIRRRCDIDEIGHVLMRGPQVFVGYLAKENNRGVLLADGWMVSGDLGRMDTDGYLWLTGRAKDLIIRGGHNIDPQGVELALAKHPAVELAAVVGCPDSYAGELPVAFVQLYPGQQASAEELRAFCQQHVVERAAVPVDVFVVPGLPLTAVGKIYKPALRREAARRIFEKQLAELTKSGVKARVEMIEHPKHGTLARIVIDDASSWEESALRDFCRTLLGGYQLHHELVLPQRPN